MTKFKTPKKWYPCISSVQDKNTCKVSKWTVHSCRSCVHKALYSYTIWARKNDPESDKTTSGIYQKHMQIFRPWQRNTCKVSKRSFHNCRRSCVNKVPTLRWGKCGVLDLRKAEYYEYVLSLFFERACGQTFPFSLNSIPNIARPAEM